MSVLVGDVIMSARSMIPDMPGVIASPAPTLTASVLTEGSSTLPFGTYYVRYTYTTPWGESGASSIELGPLVVNMLDQAIVIPFSGTFAVPVGVSTVRIYFGPQGAENQYIDIPAGSPEVFYIINAPGTPGIVPTYNRAYLPDTDGAIFPAITVFSWLRDAMKQAADLIGGIYDCTGINTTAAIPMYVLAGDWKKMSHAWVDGWPFVLGNKGQIFYRNKVTTTGSGMVVTDIRGTKATVEYYPVPNRNGGSTTLTAGITASSTTMPCASIGTYLLQYGLALLGGQEIIAYQLLGPGSALSYCLRGLGGTSAAAWPLGTSIQELNGRFAGYRYPTLPTVGQSAQTLDVPPNWDTIIQLFIESRYADAARRPQDASGLRKEFRDECKVLAAANRDMLGPKQVGEVQVNEVYNAGLGGGFLLPAFIFMCLAGLTVHVLRAVMGV